MIGLHLAVIPGVPLLTIWAPLVLVGAGVGTATVALYQLILKEVPQTEAGAGSGALQAFQQIGIALGIALVGQVFVVALGKTPDASTYIEALKVALWVPFALFAGLSLVSLKLTSKENGHATA